MHWLEREKFWEFRSASTAAAYVHTFRSRLSCTRSTPCYKISRTLLTNADKPQASTHGRSWHSLSPSKRNTTAVPSAPSTGNTALSSNASGNPSHASVFCGLGTDTSTAAVQVAISAAASTRRPRGGGVPSKAALPRATKLATDRTMAQPAAPSRPLPVLSRDHLRPGKSRRGHPKRLVQQTRHTAPWNQNLSLLLMVVYIIPLRFWFSLRRVTPSRALTVVPSDTVGVPLYRTILVPSPTEPDMKHDVAGQHTHKYNSSEVELYQRTLLPLSVAVICSRVFFVEHFSVHTNQSSKHHRRTNI